MMTIPMALTILMMRMGKVEKGKVEKSKVEKSKVECSDKPVSPSQYNSVNQFEATRKCTQANQLPPTARLYIKLYLHLCLVMHIQ